MYVYFRYLLCLGPSCQALSKGHHSVKRRRGKPYLVIQLPVSTVVRRRVTAYSAGDRPGGQEGPYICSFVRSFAFVRSRSFVRRCEVVDTFHLGSRDVIECRASMLDRTGALGRRTAQQLNCRGPTVVVFKISPSENFSPPPITLTTTTRSYPHAVRRLCVGSG